MHDAQWNTLKDLHDADKLSPFWLFVGSKGCGKNDFAKKWIRYWVRCHDISCDPRVCIVETDGDITVDMVHKVRKFLGQKQDGERFVLISNAERMNRFAQNALLKTFETAYEKTMIILTVNHIDILLPTILSRFHRLNFSITHDDIAQDLQPLVPYAGPSQYYLEKLAKIGGLEWVKNIQATLEDKRIKDEWVKKYAADALDIVYFLGHIVYQRCLIAPTSKNLTSFERINRFFSELPGTHLKEEDILRTAIKLAM